MRKLFLVLVLTAIVWGAVSPHTSLAEISYIIKRSRPLTATGIFTDADGNAMDYDVWVYGVTLYANAANSQANIKDCDTTVELLSATEYPIDEIGEPTQFETTEHSFVEMYGRPLHFSDGVGACITTGGTVIISYGVKP